MMGVRTSRHCKPDQTHLMQGTYTESDITHAWRESVCVRLLKIVFVVVMQEKCLYQLAMPILACGDHIQLQLQNHPAQVAT